MAYTWRGEPVRIISGRKATRSEQRLINQALREHIARLDEPLEETLRRVLREELQHAG